MAMELSPIWLLSLLFIIPFLYFLKVATTSLSTSSKRPRRRLAPGPTPLPIVGSLFQLGDNPHRSLARLAKTHGPIMSLKLGQITTTVVSSPDAAEQVLKKKGRDLSGRWVLDANRVLGHDRVAVVWMSPSQQQWSNLRAIMKTHSFAPRILDASQGLRREKVQELLSHVRGRMGRPVDIGGAAFAAALNLISATAFSTNLVSSSLEDSGGATFKEVISGIMEEVGKPNLVDFFPLLAPIDPHGRRAKVTKYFKQLFGMIDEMIDQRLKLMTDDQQNKDGGTSCVDLLDELLHLQLDRPTLRSLLADYFIAGTETSSVTVGWAMAELLRNPSLMAVARAELADIVGPTREVTESDIHKLSFLQAVVKETFRLHPTVPLLLPHRADADVELGPYTVPKHSQVMVNVWAIGRDENVWKDAETFAPERFLESEVDFRGQHFELIPFGSGRRMCPGMPLADRMVHLMLASLVHSFEWKLPRGKKPADVDMTETFGVTLAQAVPLLAIPLPVKG